MRKIGLSVVTFVALFFTSTASASPILDFQVGVGGSQYGVHASNVQGYDFDFVAGGWAVTNDNNSFFNYNASGGIVGAKLAGNGAPPILITMTKFGGGTFSVSSLDAATGEKLFVGNSTIHLVGSLSGGGTVTQDLTVSKLWSSYSLTGFNNLTKLVFSNTDAAAGISFDNVDLAPSAAIPEPTTLIAFGVMAVGGAGYVRRRKVAATA